MQKTTISGTRFVHFLGGPLGTRTGFPRPKKGPKGPQARAQTNLFRNVLRALGRSIFTLGRSILAAWPFNFHDLPQVTATESCELEPGKQ